MLGPLLQRSPFDHAKRVALWMLSGMVILSGYGLHKLEPFGPPHLLPLTAWDQAIPLLPWTIWLYGSETWTALLAWLTVPDALRGRRLFFSTILAGALCWVGFALYPTTYPRELYPLPPGNTATLLEFADLRNSDTPSNCLPSMHVALAWSGALTWATWLGRGWFLPILWAAGVSVATLTTKQHYLVDVPAGILVGCVAWATAHYGISAGKKAASTGGKIVLSRPADRAAVAAMRTRVENHQWRLPDVFVPPPGPPLSSPLERLLSEVIYIEEIAGLNFQYQAQSQDDPDLRALYLLFADEERRHADGLRAILQAHGHPLHFPGLGNALVLDQFDTLDPHDEADAVLIALSNPVFETFLDAGTIPFLQQPPSLRSAEVDRFVEKVCADEAQHLALNWLLSRQAARQYPGWKGLRLLLNPNLYRGMVAVPWMSLEVYSLAYQLGFDFRSLLPAFGKLWRLHQRYPELATFPSWWRFRLFVVCGAVATWACIGMVKMGLLWGWLWGGVAQITRLLAFLLFGQKLLRKRGIPEAGRV